MMNVFYDFIPVLLFFIAFKLYGIYVATVVGIVTTALQVIITTIWKRKLNRQQFFTLIVFIVFGGMTLYFHNPIFVKWKPSIIFWIFGMIFLLSHFVGKKVVLQRLMENMLEGKQLPASVWKRMNLSWAFFFLLLGTINIWIAYYFSTDTWVNFKFYGILGLLIVFSVLQAICLTRYLV
ncbi:MAG TPA: septation protein A [Gammaproteobacteria bacterium]|nr:septation protein A [Gammaproteobacteria bacterium]